MGEEFKVGCARPTGGPVGEPEEQNGAKEEKETITTIQKQEVHFIENPFNQ